MICFQHHSSAGGKTGNRAQRSGLRKKCLFQYFSPNMTSNSEERILKYEHFLVVCDQPLPSSPTSFLTHMTLLSHFTWNFWLFLKQTRSLMYLLFLCPESSSSDLFHLIRVSAQMSPPNRGLLHLNLPCRS